MRFPTRQIRRLGLIALALGTAGLATGLASFAFFTSATTPQTDSFATDTVSLDRRAPALDCVVANIEPGDSGHCQYSLRYGGTLAAWVGLDIQVRASAAPAQTPRGSLTPEGGEPLLVGGSAGLQVALSDGMGNTLGLPALTCVPGRAGASASCEGALTGQLLLDGGTTPPGAWTPGARDTVTVHWTLPAATSDSFQGGRAVIQLRARAVQATDNPLVDGRPGAGWGGGTGPVQALRVTPSTSAFGSVTEPVLVGGRAVSEAFSVQSGAGPATGLHLRLADGQATQWQVTADNCPQTLPAGSTCQVTVRFSPGQAGAVAAAPTTEQASLDVTTSTGASTSASLVGHAAWGCTASTLGCQLASRDFVNANLQGQNLSGADMQDDNLNGANLNDANLSGANLTGAAISVAQATDLNLDGADLAEAALGGTRGTGIQTTGTIWLNSTCPDGTFSYQHPGDTCVGHFLP